MSFLKTVAAVALLLFGVAAFAQYIANLQHTSFFHLQALITSSNTSFVSAGTAAPPTDTADVYVQMQSDTVVAGNPVPIRLRVGNSSLKAVQGVRIVFIKDSIETFDKTSAPYSRISGDTAIWNLDTIGVKRIETIELSLRLPDTTAVIGKTIHHSTSVYSNAIDVIPSNNSQTNEGLVKAPAPYVYSLSLSVQAANKPQPGNTASYRLLYGFNTYLDSLKGHLAFIKDPALTFRSSWPLGATAKGDTVFFNFKNAGAFFDTASVVLDFTLSPSVKMGTQISNKAFVRTALVDVVQKQAQDSLTQTIQLWYNHSDVSPVTDRQGIQWIKPVGEPPVFSYSMSAIDTTKTGALLVAGGGYRAANQQDGLVLQKISRDGITLFKKFDTTAGQLEVKAIKELWNGDIVMAGNIFRQVAGLATPIHYGLVRVYDSTGKLKWQRDLLVDSSTNGLRQYNLLTGICIGQEDAVYAVGQTQFVDNAGTMIYTDTTIGRSWVCRINYMGALSWMKTYKIDGGFVRLNDIAMSDDSHFIVVGRRSIQWFSNDESVVYKIERNTGNLLWQKLFGAPGDEDFKSVLKQKDGYLIAGNASDGPLNNWETYGRLMKVDFNGNLMWNKTLKLSDFTSFEKVKADENKGMVCLGLFYNPFLYEEVPAGIFHYDSTGMLLSSKTLNSNEPYTLFKDIAALGNEEYAVSGFLFGDSLNHHALQPKQRGGVVLKLGKNNAIVGSVYLDENRNGKKDSAEKDIDGILVKSESNGLITNSTTEHGFFKNFTGRSTYITTPVLNNSNFTVSPAADTTVFNDWFESDTIHFAIAPRILTKDLQVQLLPLTPARPGFAVTYKIRYFNAGTTTFSNVHINLQKSAWQRYEASTQANARQAADTISWNIGSVAPLTGGAFDVQLRNDAPPLLNNGDTLFLKAFIEPASGDATPEDNVFALQHPVQGSFDPNDKQELNNGVYTQAQFGKKEAFNYLIRFQNTGTDTAFRVIVRDTLDKNLDWNTLEMLSFSHPFQLHLKNGNQCEWIFENINLPDSNRNEPGSHGYLAFRIKPKATWNVGDSIRNRASIYFDFNLPVKTNTVHTLFKNATITALPAINTIDAAISVYPNPTTQAFWTTIKGPLRGSLAMRIYDSRGKLVQQKSYGRISTQTFTTKTTVAGLAKGIYFLHIALDGKRSVYKIAVQ